MTNSLTGSVGENGHNRPEDVQIVYELFNKILPTPFAADGYISTALIQAIREFQQGFLSYPDGRIDVGGRTWRKLIAAVERAEEGEEEITGSVGLGGLNRPRDVRIIYKLFNANRAMSFAVSDEVSEPLIQAIKDVQKVFMSRPDGRIDVGGRTWRKLTRPPSGAGKAVLLSFDDGPVPESALYTILDTLDQHNIKAEFYVLGKEVDSSPAAVREIVKRGHRVQNHSYTHPNLARGSRSFVQKELKKTQESILKAAGVTPTKIRPPYGAGGWPPYDPELAAVARALSLAIQNWDIDTEDWKSPKGLGPKKCVMIEQQFQRSTRKEEFNVLMHVLPETAKDLGDFIEQLKQWGYSFARP